MHFSRKCRDGWLVWVGLCCLSLSLLAGCKDNTTEQDEVFEDAERRVREQVLPELNRESEVVLRNLLNMLTVLPEVCATPLASMREFTSPSSTLGKPTTVELNNEEGTWRFTWPNVVLGDKDPMRVNHPRSAVDLSITVAFQDQDEGVLRAIPFSLVHPELATVGEPSKFAQGTTAGFFLYQDEDTGVWFLRWRAIAGEENRFFSGTITAPSGLSRLIRHPGDTIPPNNTIDPAKIVASLVSGTPQEATFSETIAAGRDQGFTFYVRPGNPVQFRLRIGPDSGTAREITINELFIGADNAQLPGNKTPGDFSLSSNEPINVTGAPTLTEAERGTFLWQEPTSSGCNDPNASRWNLRFKTPNSEKFSGTFFGENDNGDSVTVDVVAVSSPCTESPGPRQGEFSYACFLTRIEEIGGYDFCVPPGTRVTLDAFLNDVHDPNVFLGAGRSLPPSPDPVSIRFTVELKEPHSARQLEFLNTSLVLRGNNPDSDKLDLEQVSLDPPCVAGPEHLLARITDGGDYKTDRFEGSRFILEDVEFLTNNDAVDSALHRFPDRGVVRLETSVNSEESEVKAMIDMFGFQDEHNQEKCNTQDTAPDPLRTEQVCNTTEVSITVNRVRFTFPGQSAVVTVD